MRLGGRINRNISIIAIKLMGVFVCLLMTRAIFTAISMAFMDKSQFASQINHYLVLSVAATLTYALVSFFFMFKTQLIIKLLNFPEENPENTVKPENAGKSVILFALPIGLFLIGVYFLLGSLPSLISSLIFLIKTTDSTSIFWSARNIMHVITIILSVILIVKNDMIVTFLTQTINKTDQQKDAHSLDSDTEDLRD